MHRLERIDRPARHARLGSDEMRIIQMQYATAQEMADKIQKLFESQGAAARPAAGRLAAPPPPRQPRPPG